MARSFVGRKRFRKSFGKIAEIAQLPNLIALQKESYDAFLQAEIPHEKRKDMGLHAVFSSVFPVKDSSGKTQLEYFRYDFDAPKYDENECRKRGLSYASAVRVTFRLIVWDIDESTGARSIRDIKEQDVYMGDVPLMTPRGTFIINGVERVIVSQMHRSPGVFFDHDRGKTHASGKILHAARIVPYRGVWLDFEFDPKDMIYVRVDRRKKMPVTTLLLCLASKEFEQFSSKKGNKISDFKGSVGISREELLNTFYTGIVCKKIKEGWQAPFTEEHYKGIKLSHDLINAQTGVVVAEKGTKLLPRQIKKLLAEGLENILVTNEMLIDQYFANDIVNDDTGEIYIEAGQKISEETLEKIEELKLKKISLLFIDHVNVGPYFLNTLMADRCQNRDEALIEIYRSLRPGEPPTVEGGEMLFNGLFFDPERYDLSAVGRVKMNARLCLDVPDTVRTLRKEDLITIIKTLLDLKDGRGDIDDIDNLGNRRVRSVGELLENQYRMGVIRMERTIRERMSSVEMENIMPNDLVNAKPITSSIREFFGSSQLSQFMDQTNPLSEITHKRRLSALGPGGLSRDRASFEVREVHPTHYGRICPIETPEGQNIGLINSLATYACVNQYGFIESPYRRVENGQLTGDIVYMNAMEESRHTIAQASVAVTKEGAIKDDLVICRKAGETGMFQRSDVGFVDVSPKQMVSVAASLIPFLENDDAGRALMGSNMQRQAVPLLKSEAPLVGTGMEHVVAKDSGATTIARRNGIVDQVDAKRIVIRVTDNDEADSTLGVDIYDLMKFQRSNMSTCINQKPLVNTGDIIKKGDIIADGPSTDLGELALGRNVQVAFMSWQGYNFEDSIVVSERIGMDDVYTSIHIDEFEVMSRDTKLGNEEITRDIPNVSDELIRNLDESGIVYVGADVKPGDILVGKVTPKGEAPVTPEEKLLRAIFGEKASDVKDSSLRVPPGVQGTVVDVRTFSRRGIEKDERSIAIERLEIEKMAQDRDDELAILEKSFYQRLQEKLLGHIIVKAPKGIDKGSKIDLSLLGIIPQAQWKNIAIEDEKVAKEIEKMKKQLELSSARLQTEFEDRVGKLRRGDELAPGVLKMVKVYIATKRKLQPGDKMAGRHGNKGVVSRVLPIEDMPYTLDGTPVDIILNPLGLPSRMNVGQILETHLGAAAAGLGKKIQKALEAYKKVGADIADLRAEILSCYKSKEDKKDIEELSDAQLVELAKNLRKGVPVASPVFDGAHITEINDALKESGLDTSGQMTLIDGRTGEPFDMPITVGQIYILKLHHLVDDKIHARSIGPYSLVTQQPLGGKAQFGGQRFGEMEVWALEAYGAAYTLQEMLTIKSDDVIGRMKVYESIVRGDHNIEAGIPESFNVLVKELRSLGLNLSFENK
jgi:DNA-directed RNA polymerase subunit beta